MERTPNQAEFFAQSDSLTIQNAIDAAVASGERQLTVPRYNLRRNAMQWRIDRAIRLPSEFTLILDNCYLVQETGCYDHMFTNALADDRDAPAQTGIAILGRGNVCLDGGRHNRLMEKTSGKFGMPSVWCNTMFYWHNVDGLRVEGIHVENQRWWAMTHLYCRNVTLKNIDFGAVPHVPNMDGIDLRTGCHNFTIENITGKTGDDVIAMTALQGGFEAAHAVPGETPDIHDVSIRNVLGDPFLHFVVRILNHDGCQIYDIDLDGVFDASDFTSKKRPKCTLGIGSNMYTKLRKAALGETRNIHARHLTSRGEKAIRIDNVCSDSVFEDVKTFGDNLVGMGRLEGPCHFENVLLKHFFYGRTQQEMFCSTQLSEDSYTGTVFELPDTTGQITVDGFCVDKVALWPVPTPPCALPSASRIPDSASVPSFPVGQA